MADLLACICLPALAEDQTRIHHIERAQRLDVFVIGHDELTREVLVDDKGRIALPLIGRVAARGKTTDQLRDDIVRALEAKHIGDPLVMVDVLFDRPFTMRGQVKRPGEYFHSPGVTIQMAVAIAGGFTPWANDESALLIRASQEALPPLEVDLNTRVRPGDAIEIERRLD